jgi:hypothetical protein
MRACYRQKQRKRSLKKRKKYPKRKKRKPRNRRKKTSTRRSSRAVSIGVELETYSISIPKYRISRELKFPRRGIAEKGERFTRDATIGSEYNSRPFTTIREAFFLLKNGLRKYIHYRSSPFDRDYHTIFPVGGWSDRFAGSHIHVALGVKKFTYQQAGLLARRLHPHLPFIIALTANSPVWRNHMSTINSKRLLLGSKKYCQVTRRKPISKFRYSEMTYNQGAKRKPPTLEIRVPDSGVPEYIMAAACIVKAVALHWLAKKPVFNVMTHKNYLKAREEAIRFGPEASLYWKHHELTVRQYTDLFFRKYEDELDQMDIPGEVLDVFRYLKRGWNQATVLRRAVQKSRWFHRPTSERRFAKRYAHAIEALLDGNSYRDFARQLGVRLPNVERVWLGRKEARW